MPPEGESGQEPAASPEAAPAAVEATPAAPTPATEVDPFDNAEVQQFDRAYVEKLRGEAAKHRTTAKPFSDAFDGYDDASRNVLLNVVNLLKTDTVAGVKALREIADTLSPAEAAALTAEVTDAVGEGKEDEGLSVDEIVERKLAEREQATSQKAAVDAVIKKAGELGYPEGDPDHITLLWIANYQTNNDLDAAAKVLESRNQKYIDKYIADKTDSNGRFVTPTEGQTGAPADAKRVRGREAVEARIAAIARGGDS